MNNLDSFKISFLILTVFSFVATFPLSAQWRILVFVWAVIVLMSYRQRSILSKKELIFFKSAALGYLLLETLIKVTIIYDLIPFSYTTLNSIEHLTIPVALGIVVYPLFKEDIKRLEGEVLKLIFYLGILNLIGILNEFFEYGIRWINGWESVWYYPDTMRDLVLNLLGALLVSIFIVGSRELAKVPPDHAR